MTVGPNILLLLLNGTRIALCLATAFWFMFALLSGASQAGGGLKGIILNSPNALPWAALLILAGFTFRWPLVIGAVIAVIGIATIFAFDTFRSAVTFSLISAPFILLGTASAVCAYLLGRIRM